MLQTKIRARAVLALTATATAATASAIMQVLRIPPENVIRDASVRDNLRLTVSHANGGGFRVLRFSCGKNPKP
jgi:superfamily II DNA helicase RecQ